MKVPAFKYSKHFLGDIELRCLMAKVKNSVLPGVATRHIAECEEDPDCRIYLRGKNPDKISRWQQEILEQLFEKEGLAAAIEEAGKEYAKDNEAYSDCTAQEQREIKELGIAPFVWLSEIVIDEIKREVIFHGGSERGVHISEHGIGIHLRKGRWCFDDANYFIRYRSGFERPLTKKELKSEVSKMAAEVQDLFSGVESAANQWQKAFPLPPAGTPVETDPTFLFGDWEFDARKTAEVMKQLGQKKCEIESTIEIQLALGRTFYRFSPKSTTLFVDDEPSWEDSFCGCRRRGKRVSVLYRVRGGENVLTAEYWIDGGFLVEQSGLTYRRVA